MATARAKRKQFRTYRKGAPGQSPGTLIIDVDAPRPALHVIAYDQRELVERDVSALDEIPPLLAAFPVVWLNIDGFGDLTVLRRLGEMFNLHRLALEDVVSVHQRPKAEAYGELLFTVLPMPSSTEPLTTEQVSLFLGRSFVLTFQEEERPGDVFSPVRDRLRRGVGTLRSAGPGYLAYALVDALIDSYFPVLEGFGERLEALEEEVLTSGDASSVRRIHAARHDLLALRRAVWPLREVLTEIQRQDNSPFDAETRLHLRDCHDHVVQILDFVETYREVVSGLLEIYMTSVSNRMNEIMKVLTIISTLFMPLSFIAGVYGMNFDRETSPWNMPELGWYLGYPLALGLMLGVALALLAFFRHRKWL
ncbi:MAG: magnesium/cobalt transporter CorA [Candidatus Schekmanbacteria bacterium]|nr:magnesium/cobalt transporter CorA [Candidatus Schekmanbacteria bacterium]